MSNVIEGDCSKADSHMSTHREDPPTEFLPLKDYVKRNLIPGFATIKKTRDCKCHNSNNYLLTVLGEEIYIHSVEDVTNAVAEEMNIRPGKGIVPTRRKFLIPVDYNGWFEVLSQDGHSRRPIHSVTELTHLIPSTGCLVREPVTGYRKNADGHYRVQKIRAGEILQPREIMESTTDNIPGLKDKRFLICTDQKRNEIFLPMEEKGLFSPIACRSCIAGAHSIRSLLEKFRLPLMVRLLHGNIVQDDGRQRNGTCDQMFKLVGIHKEEVAFVLPVRTLTTTLEGDLKILSIPTRTKHLVAKPVSKEKSNIRNQDGKLDLKQLCHSLVMKLASTIQPSISQSDHWQVDDIDLGLNPLEKTPVDLAVVQSEERKLQQSVTEEERLFREIEDLYGWVRNPRHPLSGIPIQVQYTKANQDFPKSFNVAAFRNYSSARKVQMRPLLDGSNWKLLQQQQNLGFDKSGIGHEREGRLTNHQQAMASKAYRKTGILGDNRKYESKMRCLEPRSNSTEKHVYEEIPVDDPASNNWTRSLPHKNLTTVPVSEVATAGKCRKVVKTSAPIQNNTTSTARSPLRRGELLDHKTLLNTQHPMPIANLYEQNNAFQRDTNGHRSFRPEASNYRRPLIRPKSYAGTAVADQRLSELLGRPALPPSLPPKRGVSLSNLNTLTELQISHGDRMIPSSPKRKTLALSDPKQVEEFTPNKTNRFADNIIGSVSRSLVKTFRRIGNKTSAAFAANSSPTAEDVDGIYLTSHKNDPAVTLQQPNFSAESPKRLSIHPTMDDNILTTY